MCRRVDGGWRLGVGVRCILDTLAVYILYKSHYSILRPPSQSLVPAALLPPIINPLAHFAMAEPWDWTQEMCPSTRARRHSASLRLGRGVILPLYRGSNASYADVLDPGKEL